MPNETDSEIVRSQAIEQAQTTQTWYVDRPAWHESRWFRFLRWLAFLPGAIIAAAVAQIVINAVNYYSVGHAVDPEGFLGRIWIVTIGNAVMGAVLVLAAAWIAPGHRFHVALFMWGFFVVTAGLMIVTGSGIDDLWDVWALICSAIAGGVACVQVWQGERDTGR